MNLRLLGCCGMVALSASSAGCGGGMLNPDGGGGHGGGSSGSGGAGGAAGAGGAFMPTRDVDMLFIIDNSSSTRLLQTNLPNIHIAVITSDMGAGDGMIAGCDKTGGNQGIFQFTPRGTCTATNLAAG